LRIDIYDTRGNFIRFPQQSNGEFSHGRDARAYIAGVTHICEESVRLRRHHQHHHPLTTDDWRPKTKRPPGNVGGLFFKGE